MRKATLLAVILLAAAAGAFAIPADVTYTDGDNTLKLKSGKTQDVQVGDKMNTGDTLRTDADGLAELDQGGVTIKISGGTVFTLMEREAGGKTQTVLSMALGSIKYKYGKISGSEPAVRTNGAVAGVRGTEFTVFSGADGSTLFAVDSGAVTVEAAGKSVDLAANQGVEVPLGRPPGEVVPLASNQIDYSEWNADKFASMMADPIASLDTMRGVLDEYVKDATDYYNQYEDSNVRLRQSVQTQSQILKDKGADEANKYMEETVLPLSVQTSRLVLNYRFVSLAALSLRRFVAGRMYVVLKARYLATPEAAEWKEFQSTFQSFLATFEQSIAPRLVDADI